MCPNTNGSVEFTKSKLINILNACINKTLGDVDKNNVFKRTETKPKITGIAGDVIEQSVLGYPPNSNQAPDLIVDGTPTELKTTGLVETNDIPPYQAKEPMSITAVSPQEIIKEEFYNSHFFQKIEHLLIVYYLYKSKVRVLASEYAKFPIKGYHFFEFNQEELETLKQDWTTVRDFIISLQKNFKNYEEEYPRISSELKSSLAMIDTAPKWPHAPRFRLKRRIVTYIARQLFGEKLEQLPAKFTSYQEIDSYCHKIGLFYKNKSVKEIANHLKIELPEKETKNIIEQIIVKLFDGTAKKMQKISLFVRLGILGKTINLTSKGGRTEDVKLFCIDFDEILTNDFEESMFKSFFSDYQFLYMVFQEPDIDRTNKKIPLSENRLVGFKRLSFNDEFIEKYVKPTWDRIYYLVKNNKLEDVIEYDKKGTPRRNTNGTIVSAPNFPKSSEGPVFVRGSGKDSTDRTLEINGIKMYKQWIWIKGSFIVNMLTQQEYL